MVRYCAYKWLDMSLAHLSQTAFKPLNSLEQDHEAVDSNADLSFDLPLADIKSRGPSCRDCI